MVWFFLPFFLPCSTCFLSLLTLDHKGRVFYKSGTQVREARRAEKGPREGEEEETLLDGGASMDEKGGMDGCVVWCGLMWFGVVWYCSGSGRMAKKDST